MDVHLKFMCETPPLITMNNLGTAAEQSNCIDVTMGVHWVLFRALMVDEESQSSNSLATQHKLVLNYSKLKQRNDKIATTIWKVYQVYLNR